MIAEDPHTADYNVDQMLDPASLLAWQVAVGADEAMDETPVDRYTAKPEHPPQQLSKQPNTAATANTRNTTEQVPAISRPTGGPRQVLAKPVQSIAGASADQATTIAAACNSLGALKTAMNAFDGGLLKRSAKNLVFSSGTVGAPVMVIGEAPGAEDDQQGEAFVGRSGKLLDKMLAAAGFSRDENTYLTTLLPWRPLGSRKPDPTVIEMCLPFIKRHAELAQPKMILLLGGVPAKAMLEASESITRLRGKWKTIQINGQDIPCLPMYGPDHLISQPHLKGLAWQDMLSAKQKYLEVST